MEEYLVEIIQSEHHQHPKQTQPYLLQKVCPFVKFYKDRLSVKYEGKGLLHTDAAGIQASHTLQSKEMVGYYELKINMIGQKGDLSIGLSVDQFPQNKLPGMTRNSIGYKSDGRIYNAKKDIFRKQFPILGTGDIVGCGINFMNDTLFFTLNGEYIVGLDNPIDSQQMIPTVGLHGLNQNITFVFHSNRFVFNLAGYIRSLKLQQIEEIKQQQIEAIEVHQVVVQYLAVQGYTRTQQAFTQEIQTNQSIVQQNMFQDIINDIKQNIVQGNISHSIGQINTHFNGLFQSDRWILNQLNCFQFIQMVQNNQLIESIQFFQSNFKDEDLSQTIYLYNGDNQVEQQQIQNMLGILCYENSNDNPLSCFMENKQRDLLADNVHKSILKFQNMPQNSKLEQILQQLKKMNGFLQKDPNYYGYTFDFKV